MPKSQRTAYRNAHIVWDSQELDLRPRKSFQEQCRQITRRDTKSIASFNLSIFPMDYLLGRGLMPRDTEGSSSSIVRNAIAYHGVAGGDQYSSIGTK